MQKPADDDVAARLCSITPLLKLRERSIRNEARKCQCGWLSEDLCPISYLYLRPHKPQGAQLSTAFGMVTRGWLLGQAVTSKRGPE